MEKIERILLIFIAFCVLVSVLLVHEIRAIGDQIPQAEEKIQRVERLPESTEEPVPSDPIIVDLEQETWTDDDIFCLACVAYQEAGSRHHSNLTRRYVIDVVLNRVNDDRFPDSIRGVLEDAPNGAMQYGLFSVTGVQMLKKWTTEEERRQEEELFMLCWVDAENALRGDHTEIYGDGYVWQAEFCQGNGFWQDGMFFGKG